MDDDLIDLIGRGVLALVAAAAAAAVAAVVFMDLVF